jgi:alpha-amylase/alpha-mannosidase (GH57 family)
MKKSEVEYLHTVNEFVSKNQENVPKKESAIEFLVNRISGIISDDVRSQLMFKSNVETANEMFKEQIIDAWNDGDYSYFYSKETGKDFENGEQYYQEKYGNNQLQLSNRGNILVDQKIESYVELKTKKD